MSRDPIALYMFGLLHLQLGNWEEAAEWTGASLKINPNQPEAWSNKGLALQNLGRHEEALAAYEQATGRNPAYAGAWYNRGNVLQDMKRHDEAISSYRQALAIRPNHADTWINLGKAYKQTEHYDEARSCYGRALALAPDKAVAYNNLGNVLMELKRHEEALENFNRALGLDPAYADACLNVSLALQEMERYAEAASFARKAVALRPAYAEAHRALASVLLSQEKYDEALSAYRQALALKPGYAEASLGLGATLYELNKCDEALIAYHQALEFKPNYAEACFGLGVALRKLKKYDEALAAFRQALEIKPDYMDACLAEAEVLRAQQRYDAAQACYDQAVMLDPDYADNYAAQGAMLVELGRMAEAECMLNKALELDAGNLGALITLTSMQHVDHDASCFGLLETQYAQRDSLATGARAGLSFAMGKALESRGRYDEAFEAYAEGNRLHFRKHPHNEKEDARVLADACSFFSRELFRKYDELEKLLPTAEDERIPIFIVGMPRSGTTLIEQVLASHGSLFGAGELATLGELVKNIKLPAHETPNWEQSLLRLRELGREYLDTVWKLAPGARYITDKMPQNYRNLGVLQMMLPNAKIIHAMRDPMDVCFSCYSLSFEEGHEYSYDQEALGRHYLRYRQFMQHWHDVLPPGRILDVRYEDTVADLEGQARRILEYIGLPWDPACLNFYENKRAIKTASVAQVRKPIYKTSVARWKRFEKHLSPLMEIVRQPE